MSDSKDEGLIDSVKKTLLDRINTPLFGFILLSWIMFNWDNILFVMLSDVSIENRITAIKKSGEFPYKNLICPVASGFIFSVAFPYIQLVISYLQRWAQKAIDKNKELKEVDECEITKNLARKRVEAATAMDMVKESVGLEIAMKRQEIAKVDFDIAELERAFKGLSSDVSKKMQEVENQETLYKNIKGDVQFIERRLVELREVEGELVKKIGSSELFVKGFSEINKDVINVVDGIRNEINIYVRELSDKGIAVGEFNSNKFNIPGNEELANFIKRIDRGVNTIQLISTEQFSSILNRP
ncbi:hypothetical protein I5L29_02605 [Serratia marcescens]|nr:hypothetical protein [Serratia marcescens]